MIATLPRPSVSRPRPVFGRTKQVHPRPEPSSLLEVSTLAVWLSCAAIAALGFVLPYPALPDRKPEPVPVRAELLKVQLAPEPLVAASAPEATGAGNPSRPAAASIPSPVPVAEPSAAVAFALPVEGPVRMVDVASAAPRGRSAGDQGTAGAARAQSLTFGVGEGRQPAPTYPARALQQRQEGAVGVRLTVNEDGRVLSAETQQPCPWPLLNEAALRVVRERWRFQPGPVRIYDVLIRFRLKN